VAADPSARVAPVARWWWTVRRLAAATLSICLRYRVTGLAAEAAFFAILSLPPLLFGLAGTIGYVVGALGESTVEDFRSELLNVAEQALTQQSVDEVIRPTLDDVLSGGRADVISVGFVLALWSGSRALNVVIDTVTIMYGLGGHRGIVKTRAMSFGLYVVALVLAIFLVPLVLAGPEIVSAAVPESLAVLRRLYWPVVVGLLVIFLTTLYHVSVPVRTPWVRDLPGAALCLVLWIAGSYALRQVLESATGSTSIFGPLAAPIAVLVWLYLIAIAVLIGAAVNAAWDQIWPSRETSEGRAEKESTGDALAA
jgi:membrane protein